MVAARKIGGAVERNRARRIMRAAWREVEKTPTSSQGHDVVLLARQGISGAKMHELVSEMTELAKSAEVTAS